MIRSYTNHRQKPQLWVEIIITILGILGTITFFGFYETAFPDASVDVSISRRQAKEIAEQQLNQLGHSVEGYKFALSFYSDAQAATYLQRTLGIQEYNGRLAKEKWPIYYWAARWFKPQQKEEFYIYLAPNGTFLGLNHIIHEDAPGARISQQDARKLLETFLTKNVGWKSTEWELVESSSETKPSGRVDHSFTWKSRVFSVGNSEFRCAAVVNGDQIGYQYSYIKVPEAFIRQFASERDTARFINNTAYILMSFGFTGVALVVILLNFPDVRRAAVPTLLVAGVTLAAHLNFLPLYKSSYGTTENYALFWVDVVSSMFFSVFFTATEVFILLLGAQSLMKFVWPRQDRILARGSDRWSNFSRSAWHGLMFGGIQLAYVVLFYMLTANYLGWWSPTTSQYSDIFATPFPFFNALRVGLNAALIEELSIRFIGIGFFLWLLRGKHKWLAVLIPSLMWAFAHTSYVTFPIYVRGVELTLVALFLSFLFLKFDLLTAIVCHFTYNMMIVGIGLLRSSESYYQLSGWVVVLALMLPLIPGVCVTIRRYWHKESAAPETLILSSLTPSDLEQLSALPVKINWQSLFNQANRIILSLSANKEMIGFVTSFIDEKKIGYVDGIYLRSKWRRQYWGTTLLEAISEDLKACGASEVRIAVKSSENRTKVFLHNLFWRTKIHILIKDDSEQTFTSALKSLFRSLEVEKPSGNEMEIPRNLI